MNLVAVMEILQGYFPQVQAMYLFGSYGTEWEKADSDVDLALLLPLEEAQLATSEKGHL